MENNNICKGCGHEIINKDIDIEKEEEIEKDCEGDGSCLLRSLQHLNQYVNKEYDCPFKCEPRKCPNFEVCDSICPEWILKMNNGVCKNCEILFGLNQETESCSTTGTRLVFIDNIKCVLCGKYKDRGVKIPLGEDFICFYCFENNFFLQEMNEWSEESESEEDEDEDENEENENESGEEFH